MPAALLVVSATPLPSSGVLDDTVTVQADALAEGGPLSLAAALLREDGGGHGDEDSAAER